MHQIYQYVRISHILIIKIKKGTFPHIFTHITIDSESNKCSNVPCSQYWSEICKNTFISDESTPNHTQNHWLVTLGQ